MELGSQSRDEVSPCLFKFMSRLSDLFKFSKPKGPGFGLSKSLYISALASKASLPCLLDVVNPKGERGAVKGYGIPFNKNATPDSLRQPLSHEPYLIASPDKKTLVRMIVVSEADSGMRTDQILDSPYGQTLSPDIRNTIAAVWTLFQFTFESHDAGVKASMDFMVALACRVAELTDGVVADPLRRSYLMPKEYQLGEFDVENHFNVMEHREGEDVYLVTLGMLKLNLPEFEIGPILNQDLLLGKAILFYLIRETFEKGPWSDQDRIDRTSLTLSAGSSLHDFWGRTAVLRVVPPVSQSLTESLNQWTL